MRDVFDTKTHIYIIMEYLDGGELFTYIRKRKKLSEKVAAHVMKQLLEVVEYLHAVGIVHRDIKPENVMLTHADDEYPTVKLIDFGLSRLVGPKDVCTVPCGTLTYVAPEVLKMRGYHM
jgi:serine/threonine protein kinase